MTSNMTAMTIGFIFCVVIYLYGLTLPPDKPKRCPDCPNGKQNQP